MYKVQILFNYESRNSNSELKLYFNIIRKDSIVYTKRLIIKKAEMDKSKCI